MVISAWPCSREIADGLVVVASGSVSVYIPAPAGRCGPGGLPNYGTFIKTFKRGYVVIISVFA